MEVYHSSTIAIEKPDVLHSRPYLDFGKGFYLTTMREQAEKYAVRFTRRGKDAVLNIYDLTEDLSSYKVLKLNYYDELWLDFITECRVGKTIGDWDIVMGGIANDKVFRTIDLYFSGDIGKQECLRKLIYENPITRFVFAHKEHLMSV